MKRIILCADGTWDTSPVSGNPGLGTNVWKLYCALPDLPDQLKFYDSGVGTGGNALQHLTGGALGDGLFGKVQDCYSFLSHVYDPGDSIYLLGFSRGAYTARSVAGMIAAFGVPMKNLSNSTTPEIFAAYRERDPDKRKALKAHLTVSYGLEDVRIAMVGVWDTVGALGIPGTLFTGLNEGKYGFLDTTLSSCIEHAYQAVSLDERRAAFQPTLWTDQDGNYRGNDATVEQVWFAGGHGDVGGGASDAQLADVALGWMMWKGKECGLQFLPAAEAQYFQLDAAHIQGTAHDEWALLKWGIQKHRTVPTGAYLASSVYDRFLMETPPYRPTNLTVQGGQLNGYRRCEVLPYAAPVWS